MTHSLCENTIKFNQDTASKRVEQFWQIPASFGHEHDASHVYLQEVVSDRYVFVRGLQLLKDELQFAGTHPDDGDMIACGADLELPSVLTTLVYTNCGDRVHQGEVTSSYRQLVAKRFAMMSESGGLKFELFLPVGGGAENGETLAHVAFAHQLDKSLCQRIFNGNSQSFALVNCDLKTHVGRFDDQQQVKFGTTQETRWRDPRAACGAIVGLLDHLDLGNPIHRRLYDQLGKDNYNFLKCTGVQTENTNIEIKHVVAAAIIAVEGLLETAKGLQKEFGRYLERGVGHLTASIAVNRAHLDDTLIYLARATVFGDTITFQGLGTDARLYAGSLSGGDDSRLQLTYDGRGPDEHKPVIISPSC